MASLADLRARIAAQETKQQKSNVQSDNTIYPHWNIDDNTTATVRFLPDGNPNNEFFWVERQLIKLPFNGIVGNLDVKKVEVSVPCVEMYDPKAQCPVLAEVRPWYKDESLKELANKYWKKRSYFFQGFVRQNPLNEDKTPENPIRRFVISSQIFTIIKSSLMDPEIQELPTDYVRGLDFKITKTKKGNYADYSTSTWSRRETALTEAEQAAIEAHGLFTLADFLPKRPGEAELKIIKEMFEASVDGKPYDPERWGSYYRPYGVDAPKNGSQNQATPSVPVEQKAPVTNEAPESEEPVSASKVEVPKSTSSDKAQDILAMIRARQNKPA